MKTRSLTFSVSILAFGVVGAARADNASDINIAAITMGQHMQFLFPDDGGAPREDNVEKCKDDWAKLQQLKAPASFEIELQSTLSLPKGRLELGAKITIGKLHALCDEAAAFAAKGPVIKLRNDSPYAILLSEVVTPKMISSR